MNHSFINKLMAQELQKQLSQFGLNPKEWSVLIKDQKPLQDIEIKHCEDAEIKFIGKAKFLRKGFGYKISWKNLSLASI